MEQIAAAFPITQSCGRGDQRSRHSLLHKISVTLFAVSLPVSFLIIKSTFIARCLYLTRADSYLVLTKKCLRTLHNAKGDWGNLHFWVHTRVMLLFSQLRCMLCLANSAVTLHTGPCTYWSMCVMDRCWAEEIPALWAAGFPWWMGLLGGSLCCNETGENTWWKCRPASMQHEVTFLLLIPSPSERHGKRMKTQVMNKERWRKVFWYQNKRSGSECHVNNIFRLKKFCSE